MRGAPFKPILGLPILGHLGPDLGHIGFLTLGTTCGATAHLAKLIEPHAGQRHGGHQPRRLGGEIRVGGHGR
jgi:hypothetical protein